MNTLEVLDYIKSQPCNIESNDGVIIGQARCTVTYPPTVQNTLLVPGTINKEMIAPVLEQKPMIRLFNFIGDEETILQSLFCLTTSICLSEGVYVEVRFQSLSTHPHIKQVFTFTEQDILTKQISSTEYDNFFILNRPIDWSNIKIQSGGSTKDYAFEELCREIILKSEDYTNFIFLAQGPDRGRDGKYNLIEHPFPRSMVLRNCILQCKYSNNIRQNITQTEVREELYKVEQHHPDYYILVTNRNVTQDFSDWFHSIEGNYKFKFVLVLRQTLESIIWNNVDIWKKYFG